MMNLFGVGAAHPILSSHDDLSRVSCMLSLTNNPEEPRNVPQNLESNRLNSTWKLNVDRRVARSSPRWFKINRLGEGKPREPSRFETQLP